VYVKYNRKEGGGNGKRKKNIHTPTRARTRVYVQPPGVACVWVRLCVRVRVCVRVCRRGAPGRSMR
jgi:hypothetical protein